MAPLLKRSGQGPYSVMAQAMADTSRRFESDPNGSSSPTVIAETIAKALKARRPKTRYAAGKMAKPLLFMRQWGSDRLFDRVVGMLVH